MTWKEILKQLLDEGRMWSRPGLRDMFDNLTEEECQSDRDEIIDKWLVYHTKEWETLLSLGETKDSIIARWKASVKRQGSYFEYANEYLEREFAPKFSADKLFFTADTHFGHANIIKYCHRPFATIEEMDESLVRNWNAVVPPDATVFHLGDFCLDSKTRWKELFGRLNGKEKYLIIGNHDQGRIADGYNPGFTEVFDRTCIDVDGRQVILNHTPLEKLASDVWQFYGHVHSGPLNYDNKALPLLQTLSPTQYDVGVDNNGFRPVSFDQIMQTIVDKTENRSTKGFLKDGIYLNEFHRKYVEKATLSVAEMMKHPSSLEEAREQTRRSLQSKKTTDK